MGRGGGGEMGEREKDVETERVGEIKEGGRGKSPVGRRRRRKRQRQAGKEGGRVGGEGSEWNLAGELERARE